MWARDDGWPYGLGMRGMITGGSVLEPGAPEPVAGSLAWSNDTISAVGADIDEPWDVVVDATGCWVLPGIVDIHGDAFERALMPRPGVPVALGPALDDNDVQLLAAGITTSFLSATDSWEPGLRSRETLRALADALPKRRGGPRLLLHVRHERCNTRDLHEIIDWLDDGTIRLLSYNDHTPGGIVHVKGLTPGQIARSGVSEDELAARLEHAVGQRSRGMTQEEEISAAAARAGVVTASHDPAEQADLERDLDLGIGFAEFPITIELAHRYRDEGVPVLLGAPNLVRGGSHLGNLSVLDAVAEDAVDVLCSDYHYPSLLQAPFVLTAKGLASTAAAWSMVSARAAAAAGLDDRGVLEPGKLADVVVVEPPSDGAPKVRAAIVGGAVVYQRS